MTSPNDKKVRGAHYTIDFFGCDREQLNSLSFWQKILPRVAKEGKLDVLNSYFHKFEPQGITGFLLLSSSHISFHTWPEYNYVACDVFSCTKGEDTKNAVDYLKKQIKHETAEVTHIKRGFVTMEYFSSPVYATGKVDNIKVLNKIFEENTDFQNIVIIDTEDFGKCLVIDDIIQTSEYDHDVYDQALLEKMTPKDKKILILGGGDGYVAETILKKNRNAQITIVDLDQQVIDCAKKHLNQRVFEKKNVNLVVGDALNYMDTLIDKKEQFDGIISDLTDNPVGGGDTEEKFKTFYKKVLKRAHTLLKDEGWFSAQGGASKVVSTYLDSAELLSGLIEKEFGSVERKDVSIPSFSEKNAFLYSQK